MATQSKAKTQAQAPQDTSQPPSTSSALVPLTGGGLAAHDPAYAAELKAAAKDTAAQERPSMSKLSIKGGILSYAGQPMPNNEMNVIVLASIFSNVYYIDKYNPNAIASPRCFALSETGEDMEPHENVLSPVPATACKGCPNSEWGSDPGGGRGKACKERRRLVVIPEAAVTGALENIKKAEFAMIDLPVMSVGEWGGYVNKLAASTDLPYYAVVTQVKVVNDARSQFKVKFEGVAAIGSKAAIEAVKSLQEAAIAYGMSPYETYVAPEAPQSAGKQKF